MTTSEPLTDQGELDPTLEENRAPGRYRPVRDLEDHLGNPHDPTRAFSFANSLECDEREVFPQAAEVALRRWPAAEYLIPAELGGRLGDLEALFGVIQSVARRDLTVAVSLGANLLAALPVWIAGTDTQQRSIAALLRNGGNLALAATERGHGSDLLANGTRVEAGGSGLELTGEKWLISNAGRSEAFVVLARTSPAGGPRGFSLFLLDKRQLPPERWTALPRVRTVGLRGADVSGLRFRACGVPEGALIGRTGCGYETLQRTLTVTRTLCGALSLGAADTGLRTVLGFATRRGLYGGRAIEIPHVRAVVVGAFLDMLACEVVTVAALRALCLPDEPATFWSALVKYFVPGTIERVLQDLSVALGARFYLRDGAEGMFQKVLRDAAIVSVFEGSTVVNLGLLASQLARRPEVPARSEGPDEDRERRLTELYSVRADRRSLDPRGLRLSQLRLDAPLARLPRDDELVRELCDSPDGPPAAVRMIRRAMCRLRERARSWESAFQSVSRRAEANPRRQPARALELAGQYARLHAAAACWHTWRLNRHAQNHDLTSGDWMALCLRRLLAPPGRLTTGSAASERVAEFVIARFRAGDSFSLCPVPYAGPRAETLDDDGREFADKDRQGACETLKGDDSDQ